MFVRNSLYGFCFECSLPLPATKTNRNYGNLGKGRRALLWWHHLILPFTFDIEQKAALPMLESRFSHVQPADYF